MPKFYYKARHKNGTLVRGKIEAADPWLARKALIAQNLVVLDISRFGFEEFFSFLKKTLDQQVNRITLAEKLMFVSQLETGFSVGIPILQVLELTQGQMTNKYLKAAVTQITEDVSQGSTLHEAFEKHPRIFEAVHVGLIRAGEISGQLENTLLRLAQVMEQQVENQAKVKSAVFYPKIVLTFMCLVVTVLVYFVIPKLKVFLNTLGTDLPLITQIMVKTSDLFVTYWYLLAAIVAGIVYAYRSYVSTAKGRLRVDTLILKTPIFGSLFLNLELYNYCSLLDLLLGSGIPIFESFEILKVTQSNQVIKNEIDRCTEGVRSGGTLGQSLKESEVFPSNFTGMIAIGEESGMLPKVLKKLGSYYKIQVDYKLDNLSKLLEPLLLSVIFLMIGAIALAVFLPIWKMSSAVRMH